MDPTLKNSNQDALATVVSREARGDSKPRKSILQSWKPKDLVVDPERQARLMEKMQYSMWRTESSDIHKTFFRQLESREVSEQFRLLLGSEKQLQMVIYGLGRIEHGRPDSRIQLSIALSMKSEFNWIGDIQVFDPDLSATECSVIASLGCTVLSVNEHARRVALNPTIFFMPHCCPDLYSNLLEANWSKERLSNIALLGNSFRGLMEDCWYQKGYERIIDAGSTRMTREFAVDKADDYHNTVFSGTSWHFFSPGVFRPRVYIEQPLSDLSVFPPLTK